MLSQSHALKVAQRQREQQRREEQLFQQQAMTKANQQNAKKMTLGGVPRNTMNFSQKSGILAQLDEEDKDAHRIFDLLQTTGDADTIVILMASLD